MDPHAHGSARDELAIRKAPQAALSISVMKIGLYFGSEAEARLYVLASKTIIEAP